MPHELSVSGVAGDAWAVLEQDGAPVEIHPPPHPHAPLGRVWRARAVRRDDALEGTFFDLGAERQGLLPRDDGAPPRLGEAASVQVAREPQGDKGPRLTRRIRLPGLLLVLDGAPGDHHVSPRIEDATERARLERLLGGLPGPVRWHARSAAAAAADEHLRGEAERLLESWRSIEGAAAGRGAPTTLHDGPDTVERILAAVPLAKLDRIVVDDEALAQRARSLLLGCAPALATRVELRQGSGPPLLAELLDTVDDARRRRVRLPSGGRLILEPTAALVAVDVDSGGARGESRESVALAVNLEAVDELARRLRLLDLGGRVVVDLLDLHRKAHRERVREALAAALRPDPAPTRIVAGAGSSAGDASVVQVVRRRRRSGLLERLTVVCPRCGGSAHEPSPELVAARVVAALRDRARGAGALPSVVSVHPSAAAAVHTAHEAGVVHRDLKPANIMLPTGGGEPIVLDFGLARDDRGDQLLTRSGDQFGTPAYMSPEQVEGAGVVGRQSDVYSLGVTLYEGLTRERPFEAPTRQALYQRILHDEPTQVRRRQPAIPADLAVVVEVAMDRDPARRYQTAADLAEDLRRVRQHEPVRARPTPRLLRARRWVQRNPTISAVLVLLVAGLGIAIALNERAQRLLRASQASHLARASQDALEEDPMLALLLAREAAQREPNAETLGQLVAALTADLPAAQWENNENKNPWLDVLVADDASRVAAMRSNVAVHVFTKDGSVAPAELRHESTVVNRGVGLGVQVAWARSPHLDHIATHHDDDLLRFWSIVDGRWSLREDETVGRISRMQPLPARDGVLFAVEEGGRWRVKQKRWGKEPVDCSAAFDTKVMEFAQQPDGSFAAWAKGGGVHVVREDPPSFVNFKRPQPPRPGLRRARYGCFDFAGDWVVAVYPGEGVEVWNVNERRPRPRFAADVRHAELSRNGTRLLTFHGEGWPHQVMLWDLAAWADSSPRGHALPTPEEPLVNDGFSGDRHLSPDGRRALTLHEAPYGSLYIWDVEDLARTRLLASPDEVGPFLAVRAGSRLFAFGRDPVEFDPETGGVVRSWRGHLAETHGFATTPDGRFLATANHDQTVRLWRGDGSMFQHPRFEAGNIGEMFAHPGSEAGVLINFVPQRVVQVRSADGRVLRTLSTPVDAPRGSALAIGAEISSYGVTADSRYAVLPSVEIGGSGVEVVDLTTGETVRTMLDDRFVPGIAALGRDRIVVAGNLTALRDEPSLEARAPDKFVEVYTIDGELRTSLEFDETDWLTAIDGSMDGRFFALGYESGRLELRRADGTLVFGVEGPKRRNPSGWGDHVTSVRISPYSKLVAAGWASGTLRCFNVTGELVAEPAGLSKILLVRFSADGTRLVASSATGQVRIVDPRSGEAQLAVPAVAGNNGSVHWDRDGRLLFGTKSGQVFALPTTEGALFEAAELAKIRKLTVMERGRYADLLGDR